MSKLKMSLEKESDLCRVTLGGIIDEDADFNDINEQACSSFHFDFEAVEMINSCGIREWTNLINRLPENVELKYFKCTPDVIEQINMIVDFLGKGAIVENFYAPYFCEKCDEERRVLLTSKEVNESVAPVKTCSVCSSKLEFDALEDQYFAFLNK